MSCLDVMYHQTYGAHHYLPATSAAAAAAAYKAAFYHHQQQQQQQQQQKKLCAYSKMQDSMDLSQSEQEKPRQAGGQKGQQQQQQDEEEQGERGGREGALIKEAQPTEAEYLSSRCVLFTYFQGDIGDVVDQHFSRALSQLSAFTEERKSSRPASGGLWKEGGTLSAGQCSGFPSTLWGSSYSSQSSPCLSSVHPDFSASAAFHSTEPGTWAGHGLHPPGLSHSSPLSDSWHYTLGAQSAAGYPHVHEVYPHVHARHARPHGHTHHVLHHSHSQALDPRFSPLLLSSVRPPCSPIPHCEGTRTEPETSTIPTHGWPGSFHGSVDIFDSASEQEKGKASVWF